MTSSTKRSLCRALLSFAAAFALAASPIIAATINVPSDQKTIQAGIDAASPGDTVLVAPGTYFENIDFKGKAIAVTSSGGAAATIVDGGYVPGSATVQFASGETNASLISGFTIQGGGNPLSPETSDGGIFVGGTSPTIENNIITANYCHNIDVQGGAATILKNEISGVLLSPSPAHPCGFSSAVYLQVVAGVSMSTGSSIIGNIIENNLTGTAIETFGGENNLIMNNIIRNNISPQPGSAANLDGASTVLIQNLIYGNTSSCGGAITFSDGGSVPGSPSILIANNTIVDNITAGTSNGSECMPIAQIYPGASSYGASDPTAVIVNNIVSGSTSYPAVNCSLFDTPGEAIQPTFEYDILHNSAGPFFGSRCINVSDKYNNVVDDPQFVDAPNHDYHLKKGSPAIDVGLNSVVQTFLTMTGRNFANDFDGNPRLQDASGHGCAIDMGAYEFSGSTSDCSTTVETLTSSANPAGYGQSVTFTVQLSSTNGAPTGHVQFTDGSTILGTDAVSSTGGATFSTNTLNVGSHSITAAYQPDGTLTAASATLAQVIGSSPTNTSIYSSYSSIPPNTPLTFTAVVTSDNGIPSGTVTFTDGATNLGVSNLAGGRAALTTSTLTIGTHFISAAYNATGGFLASNAVLLQVVAPALIPTTTLIGVSPDPSVGGQAVTFTVAVASPDPSFVPASVTLSDSSTGNSIAVLAPDVNGFATFTTSTLMGGYQFIYANYFGDTTHSASFAYTEQYVSNIAVTTTILTSSLNPSPPAEPVVLTATVTTADGSTPNGVETFQDTYGLLLGTQTLVNGVAAITTDVLSSGAHSITANFTPTGSHYTASEVIFIQVVAPAAPPTATSISLNVAPTRAPYGSTILMNSSVLSSGTSLVGGTIDFMDGASVLSTFNTTAVQQTAIFSTTALAAGTHLITAVYSGDATHNGSTSTPITVTITPAVSALSLTATPNPGLALQTVTLTATLTGTAFAKAGNTIVFSAAGTSLTVTNTATTDAQGIAISTMNLPTGSYTLTASFAGNANVSPANSPSATEIVNPNPTTAALYAQPNPGYQNSNETLTASILTEFSSGPNSPTPTGTVTFFDAGSPIATAPLDAKGQAAFSSTAFTVGDHVLTAVFNGTANFVSSTSKPYTLSILPRDFSLTSEPTITIRTEHHKSMSLTLQSIGNFTDTVAVSCGKMPENSSCTFSNHGPLLAAGSTLPVTLRIDTDAIYDYLASSRPGTQPSAHKRLSEALALALLLPVSLFAAVRRRRTGRIPSLFVALFAFFALAAFTGCSGHYPAHTPAGTYTLVVTGQGVTTHVTHTATITLVVTQ